MFWNRAGREARRQKLLDELLELDPAERQAFVAVAVAAGDVRVSEVEETLRLVHRLDSLRVMTLGPSSKRASPEDLPTASLDAPALASARIPKVGKARKRSGQSAGPRRRTGSYSSRQRRPRALVAISIVPAASTSAAPDEAFGHLGLEPSREPSWPDISWLRPESI